MWLTSQSMPAISGMESAAVVHCGLGMSEPGAFGIASTCALIVAIISSQSSLSMAARTSDKSKTSGPSSHIIGKAPKPAAWATSEAKRVAFISRLGCGPVAAWKHA